MMIFRKHILMMVQIFTFAIALCVLAMVSLHSTGDDILWRKRSTS